MPHKERLERRRRSGTSSPWHGQSTHRGTRYELDWHLQNDGRLPEDQRPFSPDIAAGQFQGRQHGSYRAPLLTQGARKKIEKQSRNPEKSWLVFEDIKGRNFKKSGTHRWREKQKRGDSVNKRHGDWKHADSIRAGTRAYMPPWAHDLAGVAEKRNPLMGGSAKTWAEIEKQYISGMSARASTALESQQTRQREGGGAMAGSASPAAMPFAARLEAKRRLTLLGRKTGRSGASLLSGSASDVASPSAAKQILLGA